MKEDRDNTRSKLYNELEDLSKTIGDSEIKKYNLGTVKNFIYHIEHINENDKEQVKKVIIDYINFIKTNDPPKNNNDTILLFNEFLVPISSHYSRIGFLPIFLMKPTCLYLLSSVQLFFYLKLVMLYF